MKWQTFVGSASAWIPLLLLILPSSAGDVEPISSRTGCDAKPPCHIHAKKSISGHKSGGYSCSCLEGYAGDEDGFECYKRCDAAAEASTVCPSARHECRLDEDGKPSCHCPQGYSAVVTEETRENGTKGPKELCKARNECSECRHNCAIDSECIDLDPTKGNEKYRCECGNGTRVGDAKGNCVQLTDSKAIVRHKVEQLKEDEEEEKAQEKATPVAKGKAHTRPKRRARAPRIPYNQLPEKYKFGDFCTKRKQFTPCHKYAEKTKDYTKHQGYVCRCRAGYSGDGYFCAKNCNSFAKDTACEEKMSFSKCGLDDAGKETCVCLAGTRFDAKEKKCVDIDECEECLHNCNTKARCHNGKIGRSVPFHCICPPHHAGVGNDRCYDYNECEEDFLWDEGWQGCGAMGKMATCLDFSGFFKCRCKPGFLGVVGTGEVLGGETEKGKKIGRGGANDTKCAPSCDQDMPVAHAAPKFVLHKSTDKRTKAPWATGISTATLSKCDEGFSPKDPKKIGRCSSSSPTEAGRWVDVPECIPTCNVYSGKPHILSSYANPMRVEGSTMTIKCEPGFVLQGPTKGICKSGKWAMPDGQVPQCIEPCKELKLDSCDTKCTGMMGGYFVQNSVCQVQCKGGGVFACGKKSSEKIKAVCLGGQWTYPGGASPTCIKPCARLNIARSNIGYIDRGHAKLDTCGSKAQIHCTAGYQLEIGNGPGVSKQTVSQCTKGGWVHEKNAPQCKPGCKIGTIKIENAVAVDYGTKKPYVDIGHVVQIFCVKGSLREGSTSATCGADGTWKFAKQPKCKTGCLANLAVSCGKVTYTQQVAQMVRQGGTAHLSCEKDKLLVGATVVKCTPKGWSAKLGACKKFCERAILIDDAHIAYSVAKGPLLDKSTATITCKTGFEQLYADQAVCKDGQWLYQTVAGKPSQKTNCVGFCKKFAVTHGKVKFAELINDKVRVESNSRITCNNGFSLDGEATLRCLEEGKYDHAPPTCVKGCDSVSVAKGNVKYSQPVIDNLVTKGTTLNVECVADYSLQGTCTLTCLGDGKYDHAPPRCVAVCPQISIPHAIVGYSAQTAEIPVGGVATISCEPNYEIVGPKQAKCAGPSRWSKLPQCKPVCPTIKSLANGVASPSKSSKTLPVGEFVAFRCEGGHIMYGARRINCVGPNEYSEPIPICRPGCAPFTIVNGAVAYSTKERPVTLEGTASITCNKGYMLTGSDLLSCVATDSWSTDPRASLCIAACNKHLVNVVNGRAISLTSKLSPVDYLLTVGQSLTVVCNEGYMPSFDGKQTCVGPDKWDVNVQCLPFIETIHPGSCYAILPFNESHVMDLAATVCHTYGAHLLSIGSATEHWRVVDYLRELHRPTGWNGVRYWTGTYKPTTATCVNTDKTACPYVHMSPGSGSHTRRKRAAAPPKAKKELPKPVALPVAVGDLTATIAPVKPTVAVPMKPQFLPKKNDAKQFLAKVPDRFAQYEAMKHTEVSGQTMMLDISVAVLLAQSRTSKGAVICERPCHNQDHFSLPGKCVVW